MATTIKSDISTQGIDNFLINVIDYSYYEIDWVKKFQFENKVDCKI
jgi:hypothetical protein